LVSNVFNPNMIPVIGQNVSVFVIKNNPR